MPSIRTFAVQSFSFAIGALAGLVSVVLLAIVFLFVLRSLMSNSDGHGLAMLATAVGVVLSPFAVIIGGIVGVVLHRLWCGRKSNEDTIIDELVVDSSDPWRM